MKLKRNKNHLYVEPCRAVPCRAVPCRAVPCRAVPCRAVPCRRSGSHIVVSDGDASQSVERRCYWDVYDDIGTFFSTVADVPEVSPTSQSRWEKLRSVQLLRMSPMHRCHVPIDTGNDVPVAYDDMETRQYRDVITRLCVCILLMSQLLYFKTFIAIFVYLHKVILHLLATQ